LGDVPRQQLLDASDGMIGNAVEHMAQIGLKLKLPHGLICLIGPRESGKSTLAEALRFTIKGTVGGSKQRLDLLRQISVAARLPAASYR
jgi:predicted AAA+ superfamily ATPase